jgi:hypothetical protein
VPFILLRISYLWYTVIGMLIVLTLGTLVSLVSLAIGSIRSSWASQLSPKELKDGVVNIKNDSATEMVN